MHNNRINYTLEEYQKVILHRWNSTVFMFARRNEYDVLDPFFAKPAPRTPWLEGRPREKYYSRLYARLDHQLKNSTRKFTFCTLTYSTKKYSQRLACLQIKDHLHEFIKRLRKKYPKIQYFWVIELTKRSYPHIHIIFDQYAHWKIIKAIWYAITGSYIIDIRSIPPKSAAAYICGYVTKQRKSSSKQWAFIFKNIDRLWSCSRSFFTSKWVTEQEFYLLAMSLSCYWSDNALKRPLSAEEFWEVPYDFIVPILSRSWIMDRRLNWNEIDKIEEILNYFPRKLVTDCCNKFENSVPFAFAPMNSKTGQDN
jgi:hypothetical protein